MGCHTLRCATRKNSQLLSDCDHVCSSYRDHITLQIPLQQKLDNYSHDNITDRRSPDNAHHTRRTVYRDMTTYSTRNSTRALPTMT